jgi:hypothetical protein
MAVKIVTSVEEMQFKMVQIVRVGGGFYNRGEFCAGSEFDRRRSYGAI